AGRARGGSALPQGTDVHGHRARRPGARDRRQQRDLQRRQRSAAASAALSDPSELVTVVQVATETGASRPISPPNYFDLREQAKSFSGIAAYWSPSVSLSGAGIEPEKVLAATCSSDLFRVLGVGPAAGRAFG